MDDDHIPVPYRTETTVEGHIETRLSQAHLLHKEFAHPWHVVLITKTPLRTQARAHVLLFSSDLALACAPLVDYDGLRFQIKEVHAAFATPEEVAVSEETVTPAEEPLAPAESAPTTNYRQQLSDPLHTLSPAGFERFCQRLLRESGFEQVTITGRSGDGGIDGIGILQVSPLVSFKGLFQCKRYTSAVGSAQVRDFRGAMMGRADKGISLTTGTFTADAKREAIRDGVPPLAWVDGEKLVDRCEALELGLRPKTTFAFDPNCFDEFRQEKETGGRGHAESSGGASHMP